MTYQFRKFNPTNAEYAAIVEISNAVYFDDHTSVENVKHRDKNNEKHFYQRLVCEVNGRIVATGSYGETWWFDQPGRYFIGVLVHPDFRNQGIGSAFYDHIYDILSQKDPFDTLESDTREDFTHGISFLEKRGFELAMRFPRSILDVQAFEPEKHQGLIEKLRHEGVELLSLRTCEARFPDYKQKVYALETELDKDVPSIKPFSTIPFEEYNERLFNNPNLLPDAFFLAVDQGEFVGLSALWNTPMANKWSTGLTGIGRTHRRRGLATALKASAIGYAQSQGIKLIDTDNEENNPMYQLNLALGFKPAPAFVDYQKKIT